MERGPPRRRTQRPAVAAGAPHVADRLAAYVELYVPEGPRDPHWTLWLEVWNRSQNADADARARQAAIEGAWHRDLVALLAEGVSHGELRRVDPDRYATRLRALLTGSACTWRWGYRAPAATRSSRT